MACQTPCVILHHTEDPIFLLHKLPSVREESFACCCQPHLPRISLEELDAKLALEALNPQCERRLREIEAGGGAAKMTFAHDCQKPFDVP
jgi:hypothetical protein